MCMNYPEFDDIFEDLSDEDVFSMLAVTLDELEDRGLMIPLDEFDPQPDIIDDFEFLAQDEDEIPLEWIAGFDEFVD